MAKGGGTHLEKGFKAVKYVDAICAVMFFTPKALKSGCAASKWLNSRAITVKMSPRPRAADSSIVTASSLQVSRWGLQNDECHAAG
jgi:hypothetical protein